MNAEDGFDLTDSTNTLRVDGDSGDTVDVVSGWAMVAAGSSNGDGTGTIDGQNYLKADRSRIFESRVTLE